MRPGRQLAFLGAIFVILASAVWFGGKGGWQERLTPNLGLDLVGGSRVTLQAQSGADGQPPSAQDLEQARRIIADRVDARGVSEAQVVIEGNQNIVISVAKKGDDAIADVGQASQLFFRKVLKVTDGSGAAAAPAPAPSASPSAAATPKPSTSAKPAASAKPSASVKPSASAASGTGGGAAMATPTPTPAASKSAAPAPSASPAAAPKPSAGANAKVTVEQVQAKVGKAAWDAAVALTAPATDPVQIALLKPFSTLSPKEIAVVPPAVQFNVPQVTCLEQLDKRPPGSINQADKQAVACENGTKYFLDISKVAGTDIDKASPQIEQNTNRRVVSMDFSSDGLDKWTALTKEAFKNEGDPKCDAAAVDEQGRCAVAVVLDNKIISAPFIQGVLGDDSVITGNFDAKTAADLANNLNYGSLSMTFEQQEAQTITPTLGGEHLKAGLLAAGIGMLLVIIYSFFYYRLLGTVIFLSLVLSGALTFLALVFLGREMGFTLTLAGIAGFIVSLGVAADSFVIYFERLKDEIREGRSPRSAVQRAWVRARKTILTANAISLMAAVVLYLVSSGAVAGFAFALGLATLLDLIVVFLFRYPIMALFARTDAFLSPRVSGLGRVLHEAKEAN